MASPRADLQVAGAGDAGRAARVRSARTAVGQRDVRGLRASGRHGDVAGDHRPRDVSRALAGRSAVLDVLAAGRVLRRELLPAGQVHAAWRRSRADRHRLRPGSSSPTSPAAARPSASACMRCWSRSSHPRGCARWWRSSAPSRRCCTATACGAVSRSSRQRSCSCSAPRWWHGWSSSDRRAPRALLPLAVAAGGLMVTLGAGAAAWVVPALLGVVVVWVWRAPASGAVRRWRGTSALLAVGDGGAGPADVGRPVELSRG